MGAIRDRAGAYGPPLYPDHDRRIRDVFEEFKKVSRPGEFTLFTQMLHAAGIEGALVTFDRTPEGKIDVLVQCTAERETGATQACRRAK